MVLRGGYGLQISPGFEPARPSYERNPSQGGKQDLSDMSGTKLKGDELSSDLMATRSAQRDARTSGSSNHPLDLFDVPFPLLGASLRHKSQSGGESSRETPLSQTGHVCPVNHILRPNPEDTESAPDVSEPPNSQVGEERPIYKKESEKSREHSIDRKEEEASIEERVKERSIGKEENLKPFTTPVPYDPEEGSKAQGSSNTVARQPNIPPRGSPNFFRGQHMHTMGRPPTYRKIFDPTRDIGLPPASRDKVADLLDQSNYIGRIAAVEIPNFEILPNEVEEREALRRHLEEICQNTVAAQEMQENPSFDKTAVTLKCVGGVKNGFGLRGSDVDLVLLSPFSKVDIASTESPIPGLLEQVLLAYDYGVRLVSRMRAPLIKGCTEPTPALMTALMAEHVRIQEEQLGSAQQGEVPQYQEIRRSDEELVRLYRLAISEGWFSQEDKRIIYTFMDAHRDSDGDTQNSNLLAAREALKVLPNVIERYRDTPDNRLDIPQSGCGIHWDMNFSSLLAWHNTHLLYCYSLCDPRIRELVLFVKAWAKKRDVNSPFRGTLSSYGYALMVIHYAVNIASPSLAPNLQLQLGASRGGAPGNPKECNGRNIQFWRDDKAIKRARKEGKLTYSKESLGSLLRGFFQYFAENGKFSAPGLPSNGFFWTNDVISIRTQGGLLTKPQKGWTGARTETIEPMSPNEKPVEVRQRFLLCIEDPFDLDTNVARPVTHDGICAIRDEFRRANRIIQNLGVIDNITLNLFEEGNHQELDRKRTFFGPNPAMMPRIPTISSPPLGGFFGQNRGPMTNNFYGRGRGRGRGRGFRGAYGGAAPRGNFKAGNAPEDVEISDQAVPKSPQKLRESASLPDESLVEAGLLGKS